MQHLFSIFLFGILYLKLYYSDEPSLKKLKPCPDYIKNEAKKYINQLMQAEQEKCWSIYNRLNNIECHFLRYTRGGHKRICIC